MSADIDRIGLATVNLMANITHEIHDLSPRPLTFGGYSEIHTGVWRSKYGEMKVAIKVIRATLTAPDTDELPRVLRHEIRVWKKLLHRNIHIMCGFFEGYGSAPALVSPWYENGDINRYVRSRARAPDIGMLKLKLLADVTSGLKFLHEHYIVHGDIKGGNVLVSDDGVARLCDFGLSHILLDHSQSITHTGVKGTLRWMAPELILVEGSRQSYASDTWACGCLFIEVWSTLKPYHTKTNEHQVIFALSRGELPARPTDMPDSVWTIVEGCCNFDTTQRPSPADVLALINVHLTMQRLHAIVTRGGPLDSIGSDLLKGIESGLRASQLISELHFLVDTELVREIVKLFALWCLPIGQRSAVALFYVDVLRWCLENFDLGRRLPSPGVDSGAPKPNDKSPNWTFDFGVYRDTTPPRSPTIHAVEEDEDDGDTDEDSRIDSSKLRPFARLLAVIDPAYAAVAMLRFAKACVHAPMRFEEAIPCSVVWFPDGNRICVGTDNGAVDFRSTASGLLVHRIYAHATRVNQVAISLDGRLLASCSTDRTVRLWDAETGNAVAEPMVGHTAVRSVAFSPDGIHLASGSNDQTIRVWSCETGAGAAVGPFCGHTETVSSVAYSPDGSRIVSVSWDATVRVWDVQTGSCILGPLSGQGGWIASVSFSPDGLYFVSGSLDGTVRVWDAFSGEPVGAPMEGHRDAVRCVAHSPHGARISSCSADYTVRLWDAATRALIHRPLRGHRHLVMSAAFSPDGRKLASASDDHTVRIWDATDEWTRWDI